MKPHPSIVIHEPQSEDDGWHAVYDGRHQRLLGTIKLDAEGVEDGWRAMPAGSSQAVPGFLDENAAAYFLTIAQARKWA